jgi:hypothetical protein
MALTKTGIFGWVLPFWLLFAILATFWLFLVLFRLNQVCPIGQWGSTPGSSHGFKFGISLLTQISPKKLKS